MISDKLNQSLSIERWYHVETSHLPGRVDGGGPPECRGPRHCGHRRVSML